MQQVLRPYHINVHFVLNKTLNNDVYPVGHAQHFEFEYNINSETSKQDTKEALIQLWDTKSLIS